MDTALDAPGTAPVLQSAALFQLPLTPAFHATGRAVGPNNGHLVTAACVLVGTMTRFRSVFESVCHNPLGHQRQHESEGQGRRPSITSHVIESARHPR
jgi:hypothetical protein